MVPDAPALTDTVLDHVAVAVHDVDAAVAHWLDLGATPVAGGSAPAFSTEQVRLSNGGKVELIGHGTGDGPSFVDGFLSRFGSGRIHHITLKVPGPIRAAADALSAAGFDVVDVAEVHPTWHEAFLRPSQVGGLIVQVAWAPLDDEGYARHAGRQPPPPVDPEAPALRRVVLGHPDLDAAARVWGALGAGLAHERAGGGFTATFTRSPVAVEVRPADTAGPIGLHLEGLGPVDRGDLAPALL